MAHASFSDMGSKGLAEAISLRFSELDTSRKEWEPLWRKVATYIDPASDDFVSQGDRKGGDLKGEKVFDNTAIQARDRLVAAHDSTLTPRNSKWHGLKASDDALNDIEEVKEWCEGITSRIFAARYNPRANFAAQIGAYYQSLVTFGTGVMFIDEEMGSHIRYRALHLNEAFIDEDHTGRVDTIYRRFQRTARQAVMMAERLGGTLPKDIMTAAKDAPDQKFWFIHAVEPNPEARPDRIDPNSMPVRSIYLAKESNHIISQGGYRTLPYAIGRYSTGPREIYGRSPGMAVLRDIQMLNEINKTVIRVAQRQADPPLFVPEEGAVKGWSMRPGKLNYGAITGDGKPMASAFHDQADLSATLEIIQDRRTAINDAFLVTLFQILVEKAPNMTATEALLRAQEKGVLLTPVMGRQQSEFLGTLIEREIDLLTEAGQFEDMPMPEVLLEAGASVEVVYDAPLNRLQRTDEAVGILRTVEALAEPAKIDPGVYDVFQWEKVARVMGEANGAPAKVMNTLEEMAMIRQQREQSKQMEQAAVVGPAIGKTIKDISQAQAVAGNVLPSIPQVAPA